MHLPRSGLVVVTALASSAGALRTAPGSPCSKDCGNVLSATTPNDMECYDDPSKYSSTAAGTVLRTCITCQMSSPYVSDDGQSDLQWLLYNLRYTSSTCMFGVPNNEAKKLNTGPCGTRTACEPFQNSLQWQNLSTTAHPYDYCKLWDEFQFTKCSACLAPGQHYVAANMMTMLDAGCKQKPSAGHTISVSDQPFTSTIIKVTDPSPVGTFRPDDGPLNLGAKVGIAVAAVVLLLLAVGCGIICNGKRRRRAFLRNLEKRQAQGHLGSGFGGGGSRGRWPSGGSQGGDMFETPVSQKPLFTNWEQSPVSAHTDQTGFSTGLSPAVEKGGAGEAGPSSFPSRYFSPYSSQFNSPVSGQESTPTQWPQPDGQPQPQPQQAGISGGLSPRGWPTSTQEKLFQLAHMQQEQEEAYRMQLALQRQQQQQQRQQHFQPGGLYPQDIGLAFGGDDPSLRSKASAQSMQSHEGQPQPQQQRYPLPPQQQQQQQHQSASPQQPQQYHNQTSPWGFSDVKGKQADYYPSEEYELHEVDSNGSVRVPSGAPTAPVLNHPGYGRYPPPPAPAAVRPQW